MTSRDFAYWLQGFFELSKSNEMSKEQVEMVKKHLNMVFYHDIDKSFKDDLPKLTEIHHGPTLPGLDLGSTRVNC